MQNYVYYPPLDKSPDKKCIKFQDYAVYSKVMHQNQNKNYGILIWGNASTEHNIMNKRTSICTMYCEHPVVVLIDICNPSNSSPSTGSVQPS